MVVSGKNIVLVCCLIFCIGICNVRSQEGKKIKRQIETGYIPAQDGNLVPDQSEIIKSFDERGNLIEKKNTRNIPAENRTMKYRLNHYYNSENRFDSSLVFNDDKFGLKLEYRYNSSGLVDEIQEYNSLREPNFLTKQFHDSSGNKIREELYTKDKKLYNFKLYSYDSNNNLIDESGSEQGQKRFHWIYKYNKKNQLIERKDFSGQEVLLRKHTYEYDKEGRLVRENIYNESETLERIVKVRYEFY
ncbi:MAG: hypothetical protein HY960_10360 [Ignavibacteriae bacterium]|nr:hypothetical protein [Ignavibacteriota bacterium]